MRTKYIFLCVALAGIALSCGDDEKVVDPIYDFIAFAGNPSVNLNEAGASTAPYPLVIQLYAYRPYQQETLITIETTGTNAVAGTDFTVSSNTVRLREGSLVSDTVWVSTIDNGTGATAERTFTVKITDASWDILIGLGPTEKKNESITFNILDDECSLTTEIFNSPSLQNLIDGSYVNPAAGTVAGTQFTVAGVLLDYWPEYTLIMTLTPNSPGATKGTATFGDYNAGVVADGYEYEFRQTGTGSYDVCSKTIDVSFDVYYMDGSWTYWYSATNTFSAN